MHLWYTVYPVDVRVIRDNLQSMSGPLNNHELRKLLLSLPGKAVRILCDQYYPALLKIAFSLTHDHEAAKDIVQETFCHIWKNARRLGAEQERSIQHYLVRVVRNRSISYYHEVNAQSREKARIAGTLQRHERSPELGYLQLEYAQEIRDMIARFPQRERECLALKLDEELSNPEISARLGVGIKAVERSLTSARKRLRNELEARSKKKT